MNIVLSKAGYESFITQKIGSKIWVEFLTTDSNQKDTLKNLIELIKNKDF